MITIHSIAIVIAICLFTLIGYRLKEESKKIEEEDERNKRYEKETKTEK